MFRCKLVVLVHLLLSLTQLRHESWNCARVDVFRRCLHRNLCVVSIKSDRVNRSSAWNSRENENDSFYQIEWIFASAGSRPQLTDLVSSLQWLMYFYWAIKSDLLPALGCVRATFFRSFNYEWIFFLSLELFTAENDKLDVNEATDNLRLIIRE